MILNGQRAHVECLEPASADLPDSRAWLVGNRVGESPTWDTSTQTLIWIDVRAPEVLQLDPRSSMVTRWSLPEVVGALGLADGSDVILALKRSLALLSLDDGTLRHLVTVDEEPVGNRLNDGKVSPSGRWFVFGSMDDHPSDKQRNGALYAYEASGNVRRLFTGLTVANGIAWAADGAHLYFSDSHAGQVWKAVWDEHSGTMGEPRLFCESGELEGRPDGAAVDAAGNYWSAGVSASRLNCFDPWGGHLPGLALPCRSPTMPCFGGSRLDTLFITSLVRSTWTDGPKTCDGALLALTANLPGLASARWRARGVRSKDHPCIEDDVGEGRALTSTHDRSG